MIGLAGLGAAFLPAPAQAALGPSQNISISNVAYTCKATNAVINQSVGGPQTFLVNARSSVPSSVASGDAIPSVPATLDLVMPAALMDRIRLMPTVPAGGVKTIAGSATSDVILEGVTTGGPVGSLGVPVDHLAASAQNVPASGSMTIPDVTGSVASFTAPDFGSADGSIYVELPLYFQLHAVLDPAVLGSISKTDLDCYRQSDTAAQRVLGAITVGAGCSATACALPAVDRTCVPSWADASQHGAGCRLDGSSGTPSGGSSTTPADPGGGSTGSSGGTSSGSGSTSDGGASSAGNGSNGGSGKHGNGRHSGGSGTNGGATSGTTQVVATTALPDTGSPIRPWLIGVLALAVLARVALFARRRTQH